MPNWLGDAVMATPILEDLKAAHPSSEVTTLSRPNISSLLKGSPYVDKMLSFEKGREKNVLKEIKSGKFDLGILLTNSFSSAYQLWRGQVRCRFGFRNDFRHFFLTKALSIPVEKGKEHLVRTYKRLLSPLGIEISDSTPRLFIDREEKEEVEALLLKLGIPQDATLVGINPGAAYGSAKCWLPERFKKVAEALLENPKATLLFFGDKTGKALADEICAQLPARAINLAGKTNLRQLLALIDKCDVFLTNDSGPMHMAAALKVPLVALFGSTNEIATGPYKHGHVIHKHVSCSPCYKRTCPIDFKCMKSIEVREVLEALDHELAKVQV